MTYTDYNGEERTEDFYFNLTKAELAEMHLLQEGGLVEFIQKVINEQNIAKLTEMFKDLILKAYGEKSLDGKRFVKSKEISDAFSQTEAYSDLFISLLQANNAVDFLKGIIPKDLAEAEIVKQHFEKNEVPTQN